MLRARNILIAMFLAKILMDFLVPNRDGVFLMTSLIGCVAFGLGLLDRRCLREKDVPIIFCVIFLCLFWAVPNGDFTQTAKFLSLIPLYYSVRWLAGQCSDRDLEIVAKSLAVVFVCSFVANYGISLAVADPVHREFFNFEHANLLGSYIVAGSVFCFMLRGLGKSATSFGIIQFLMAAASTSTGAMVLGLVPFLSLRKLSLKRIGLLIVGAVGLAGMLYFGLLILQPELYKKIFGPLSFLLDEGFSSVAQLARSGISLQHLDDKYQSSLVWRFYAYAIFFDYLMKSALYEFIFGHGFGGFLSVWEGIAPHNDFLTIFIDMGAIALIVALALAAAAVKRTLRISPVWTGFVAMLVIRLAFENNIYSYYISSFMVMAVALMDASMKRIQ